DPVAATAPPRLDDPEWLLERGDAGVLPDAAQRLLGAEAGPGAAPGGVNPGEVETGEEVVGERGARSQVGEEGEDALAGGIDVDFGADRLDRGSVSMSTR